MTWPAPYGGQNPTDARHALSNPRSTTQLPRFRAQGRHTNWAPRAVVQPECTPLCASRVAGTRQGSVTCPEHPRPADTFLASPEERAWFAAHIGPVRIVLDLAPEVVGCPVHCATPCLCDSL
jgi:hypothetical protein